MNLQLENEFNNQEHSWKKSTQKILNFQGDVLIIVKLTLVMIMFIESHFNSSQPDYSNFLGYDSPDLWLFMVMTQSPLNLFWITSFPFHLVIQCKWWGGRIRRKTLEWGRWPGSVPGCTQYWIVGEWVLIHGK